MVSITARLNRGRVHLTIYCNKKQYSTSLGIQVDLNNWDKKLQRVIGNDEANAHIDAVILKLKNQITDQLIKGVQIDFIKLLRDPLNKSDISVSVTKNISDHPEKYLEIRKCEHIFDECIKRSFIFYNIFNGSIESISVCNEWFKLKFQEYCKELDILVTRKAFRNNRADFLIRYVYNNIVTIGNFTLTTDPIMYFNKNYLSRSVIKVQMSSAPDIYYSFQFYDFVEYVIHTLTINQSINPILKRSLYSMLYHIESYYTSEYYCKINNIIYKLRTSDVYDPNFIIYVNDLIIEINILKTQKRKHNARRQSIQVNSERIQKT